MKETSSSHQKDGNIVQTMEKNQSAQFDMSVKALFPKHNSCRSNFIQYFLVQNKYICSCNNFQMAVY